MRNAGELAREIDKEIGHGQNCIVIIVDFPAAEYVDIGSIIKREQVPDLLRRAALTMEANMDEFKLIPPEPPNA